MKKFILILGLFILLTNLIYAQKSQEPTKFFRLGLEVNSGLTWLKPNSNNYSSNGSYVGFGYGLMTDFFFTKNYAFSTGLDVSYYGGKLIYQKDVAIDGEFHAQYIEIPLTIKMKREIGDISYFAQIGFNIGVNLNSTEDWNYTGSNIPATNNSGSKIDISDNTNLFRSAFLVEAGIEYSLKENTRIVLGIAFNNGLTHLMDKNYNEITTGQFGGSEAVNNSLGLKVGVFF